MKKVNLENVNPTMDHLTEEDIAEVDAAYKDWEDQLNNAIKSNDMQGIADLYDMGQ